MTRRTLIYGPNQETLVSDGEEKELIPLLILAFGALQAIHRGENGTARLEGLQLEKYRNFVSQKIIETVGQKTIEKAYGIELNVSRNPIPTHGEAEGVQ